MKENYIRKLAIDLSTTNIGICCELKPNEVTTEKIKLNVFCDENLNNNINYLNNYFKNIATKIDKEWRLYDKTCIVGIEISNFNNPLYTGRFNLYAGVIISTLIGVMGQDKVIFKIFNSNEWQNMVGCVSSDKRQTRKHKALKWAIEHGAPKSLSEDEYDAYCIHYFLEKLRTTEQIRDKRKSNDKKHQSDKSQISLLNKKIINRLTKIQNLDKVKNIRQINKLNNEISIIKCTINNMRGGKNE